MPKTPSPTQVEAHTLPTKALVAASTPRRRPMLAWATRFALHHSVTAVARAARLTPVIWAARRQVRVTRNLSYVRGDRSWAHKLDVHRPKHGTKWPVVLYVHGGGFGLLSKDSHWHIATALASHGFWVANINYRLAPKHPYPAALEDSAAALAWVLDHAEAMGGDVSQVILAGESAGANLVTALALSASHRFAPAWAQAIYERNIAIKAVLPACGLLEVANGNRYRTLTPNAPDIVLRHIHAVCDRYVTGSLPDDLTVGLASPLALLESDLALERPLPPFWITCGDADPILLDSTRLASALEARGAPHTLKLYPNEGHAFQALPWRLQAKAHWQDTVAYLKASGAPAPHQASRAPL